MAVTAKDIAKEVGVSPATVSMVFHGKTGVSEETRAKVLAAAQKLGEDEVINEDRAERNGQQRLEHFHYSAPSFSFSSFFSALRRSTYCIRAIRQPNVKKPPRGKIMNRQP